MAVDRSRYLDKAECEAMMNAAELRSMKDLERGRVAGVLAWMIVDAAIQTGLRVSELAALKVEDIDLRQGSLSVLRMKKRRRRKSKAGPKQIAVHNAVAKPVRETLAIDPELAGHLKQFIQWRADRIANMNAVADLNCESEDKDRQAQGQEQKERLQGLTDTIGTLFVGQRGPLGVQGLQQAWNTVAEKVGITRINHKGKKVPKSIHTARHTMAVHLLRQTKNLYQVQRQLGHVSPATTANFYSDISFEDMQAGVTGLFNRKKDEKRKKR